MDAEEGKRRACPEPRKAGLFSALLVLRLKGIMVLWKGAGLEFPLGLGLKSMLCMSQVEDDLSLGRIMLPQHKVDFRRKDDGVYEWNWPAPATQCSLVDFQ